MQGKNSSVDSDPFVTICLRSGHFFTSIILSPQSTLFQTPFPPPTASNVSEFSATYHGSDNFIVWLMDGNTGQNIDLIANEIGSSNSTKAVGINSAGDYILNVQANGPWTVTITQPRKGATQSAPLTLQGTGNQASELFTLENGLRTFNMDYHGSNNFIVWLMDDQGNQVDLLANQIGNFNGSKAVGIPQTGNYLLNIQANGKWKVSID